MFSDEMATFSKLDLRQSVSIILTSSATLISCPPGFALGVLEAIIEIRDDEIVEPLRGDCRCFRRAHGRFRRWSRYLQGVSPYSCCSRPCRTRRLYNRWHPSRSRQPPRHLWSLNRFTRSRQASFCSCHLHLPESNFSPNFCRYRPGRS